MGPSMIVDVGRLLLRTNTGTSIPSVSEQTSEMTSDFLLVELLTEEFALLAAFCCSMVLLQTSPDGNMVSDCSSGRMLSELTGSPVEM